MTKQQETEDKIQKRFIPTLPENFNELSERRKQTFRDKAKEGFKQMKLYKQKMARAGKYYTSIKSGSIERGLSCCSKEEFSHWLENEAIHLCDYCKSGIEIIKEREKGNHKLYTGRLSIDRKDNSIGYKASNLTFACFRCNKLKSSYYTHSEMLQIGATLVKIYDARIAVSAQPVNATS